MQRRLRLRKKDDFARVFKQGKAAANHQLVIYFRRSPETETFRFGVSVSKKIGNAVVRNRLRRMIKEIMRLHAEQVDGSCDLIVIVRKAAVEMAYAELDKSLMHVLKKAGLFKRK